MISKANWRLDDETIYCIQFRGALEPRSETGRVPGTHVSFRYIKDTLRSGVKRWRPGMLPKRIQPGTLGHFRMILNYEKIKI